MVERMKFIAMVEEKNESMAAICRAFGVSRKTGYKWLERFQEYGPEGLQERSSAPRKNGNALRTDQIDAIVALRKERPSWGPRKLHARLRTLGTCEPLPAVSTIGAVIKRHGLIRPRRRRAIGPRELTGLTIGERPNEVWCVDFKGDFLLGDGTRCYPLTITDYESRYLIACVALSSTAEAPANEVFKRVFLEYGLPEYIRSDNGTPFSSTGIGGLTKLCIDWIKLGIVPERIEPGHPEQNGRHERMHRTLKAEATRPPQYDLAAQQRAFDRFRHEYNDERPHEAIGLRTPASRYAVSRRRKIEFSSPTYPDTMQTRALDARGRLRNHGKAVAITKSLATEFVGIEQVADGVDAVYFGPLRLGILRLQGKELVLERGAQRRIRAAITL
jgi:transposase InsO family protein